MSVGDFRLLEKHLAEKDAEIERLTNERYEARFAAKMLWAELGHKQLLTLVPGTRVVVEQSWPWLKDEQ